jgi:hypothetical protein
MWPLKFHRKDEFPFFFSGEGGNENTQCGYKNVMNNNFLHIKRNGILMENYCSRLLIAISHHLGSEK